MIATWCKMSGKRGGSKTPFMESLGTSSVIHCLLWIPSTGYLSL
jgi:hypothetical protein